MIEELQVGDWIKVKDDIFEPGTTWYGAIGLVINVPSKTSNPTVHWWKVHEELLIGGILLPTDCIEVVTDEIEMAMLVLKYLL